MFEFRNSELASLMQKQIEWEREQQANSNGPNTSACNKGL